MREATNRGGIGQARHARCLGSGSTARESAASRGVKLEVCSGVGLLSDSARPSTLLYCGLAGDNAWTPDWMPFLFRLRQELAC
jgi:hypothetical protein